MDKEQCTPNCVVKWHNLIQHPDDDWRKVLLHVLNLYRKTNIVGFSIELFLVFWEQESIYPKLN